MRAGGAIAVETGPGYGDLCCSSSLYLRRSAAWWHSVLVLRGYLIARSLAIVAAVLAVVALYLAAANPTVHTASDGDYGCYAPYDIVLNDVHTTGMPNDYGQVESACQRAAQHRFRLAVGFGKAAGVVTVIATLATVAAWRSSRRRSAEELYRLRNTDA